jgi:hypothetical protein
MCDDNINTIKRIWDADHCLHDFAVAELLDSIKLSQRRQPQSISFILLISSTFADFASECQVVSGKSKH